MTDTPPLGATPEVIIVTATATVSAAYWPSRRVEGYALLEQQIREQIGGVVPEDWRRYVAVVRERDTRNVRLEATFRAIKHEHRPRRRYLGFDSWVEVCWTDGCDHQEYHSR